MSNFEQNESPLSLKSFAGFLHLLHLNELLHIFFPSCCPVCGRLGTVGCGECLQSLIEPAIFHPQNLPFPVCSGGEHLGLRRDLILMLKYDGFVALGLEMGRALGMCAKEYLSSFISEDEKNKKYEKIILVPIPLHIGSQRPYNQALILAKGLVAASPELCVQDNLKWKIKRPSQTSGLASRRIEGNAMEWIKNDNNINKSKFILIDDVITGGETMRSAAQAGMRAGIKISGAITWSRGLGSL